MYKTILILLTLQTKRKPGCNELATFSAQSLEVLRKRQCRTRSPDSDPESEFNVSVIIMVFLYILFKKHFSTTASDATHYPHLLHTKRLSHLFPFLLYRDSCCGAHIY